MHNKVNKMDISSIQTTSYRICLLILAGGFGAVCRYGLSTWLNNCDWCGKPWGILVCNLLGCFLIGLLSVVLTRHCSAETQLIVITGLLGAFTTFSTYALDSVVLMEQTRYAAAFMNLALHNVLGIAMAFGGLTLGRFFIRG